MRYGGWSGVFFGRKETDIAKPVEAKFPTSFGVFSPTGHIVDDFLTMRELDERARPCSPEDSARVR